MCALAQAGGVSLKKRALRKKLLNVALTSREFRETLGEAATEIRSIANPDATEATVEGAFESVLYAQLRGIGLKFHPIKEQSVQLRRHVTRGRMDSRLGALVIEYKRPSLLKSPAEVERALDQLKCYLVALSKDTDTPFMGLLTNGLVTVEIRAQHGVLISQSSVEQLSGTILLRLTQQFVSLALAALTPANLIRDFCGSQSNGVLFETARVLNVILSNGLQPKTEMLFREWEEMFRLAHDDQSQQRRIGERRSALASLFSINIADAAGEYRALFALHTAYAIVLKLMAYRTVSDIHLGEPNQDYRSLATASDSVLRIFCNDLEDGEVFRLLGIINLLEGDFFSWYCDRKQWTPALAGAVKSIVEILARYEEVGRIFDQNEASDLFRDLYQAAVPRVVRSSFGEFYTPHWLAAHVLEAAKPAREWRALDPCCGSGTFVIAAIAKVRSECEMRGLPKPEILKQVLARVVAIDLNPLSVLTARINYFIHVSELISFDQNSGLVIPVFLGDAASIPERISVDGYDCLSLQLTTLQDPIFATLPVSLVQDTPRFMRLMLSYEQHIKQQRADEAKKHLLDAVSRSSGSLGMRRAINNLTDKLIELEARGWNGIWARILSNFLTTACLGQFDVVVGNPPWIDWKNLPQGYRERIKGMCIERGLFSGAGRTGGINLNICALISYVSMTNWLKPTGRLAFLMPRELASQASYEGWRRLGGEWSFLQFDDWSLAGYPFEPVREDFMTFVVGRSRSKARSVPVRTYALRRGAKSRSASWKSLEEATRELDHSNHRAGQIIPGSTSFTIADNQTELDEFALVAGECAYIGREGVQFYPQELHLFRYAGNGPREATAYLINVQATKSQHRLPKRRTTLETKYLSPLVTAPAIKPFQHHYDGLLVPFPYEAKVPKTPVPPSQLRKESPFLLAYYNKYRDMIESLSKFNSKIRGPNPGAFYGLARTGPYRFAKVYVAFRKDTHWCSVVVSSQAVPWGKAAKNVVFQSHAVSMCERQEGGFISAAEAHYICAIFNAPIVERFITATSDKRSFKVRPPVFVPRYDRDDDRHVLLANLSRRAHKAKSIRNRVREECEQVYLSICADESYDEMLAGDRLAEIESGALQLVRGGVLQSELAKLLS